MKLRSTLNKRGQITHPVANVFFGIVALFAIAIILLILSKTGIKVKENLIGLEQFNETSPKARAALDVLDTMPRIFNGVFFIIFVALCIGMVVFSFLVDTHPLFFVAFIVAGFLAVIIAVAFSNAYETIEDTAYFEDVKTSFSLQSWIFSKLPTFTYVLLIISGVIMFAKARGMGGAGI